MKKYKVILSTKLYYEVIVESEDDQEAIKKALDDYRVDKSISNGLFTPTKDAFIYTGADNIDEEDILEI